MSYKVAVASSDGKFINRHFGHSNQFLVFELDETNYKFLELRQNAPPCNGQEHHEGKMAESIDLLSDCRAILASRIGPGAAALLSSRGIIPLEVPDFIDDTLKKLLSSGYLKNQFKE